VCLSAIGVGFMMRKLGGAAHPEQTWAQDADGTVRVHTVTTFKTSDLAFKLGVEFDEKRVDDEVCKSLYKLEGDKLVQTMSQKDGKVSTITREVQGNQLVATCVIGDITSIRKYTKQ
jgi:hypothetical protein